MWNTKMIVCLGLTSVMIIGICKACVLPWTDIKGTSSINLYYADKCPIFTDPYQLKIVGVNEPINLPEFKIFKKKVDEYFLNYNSQSLNFADFSNNNIAEIDLTSLRYFENLKSLNVSFCQLKQLSDSENTSSTVSSLKYLYLNNNNISNAIVFSKYFPHLEKLYLQHNNFSQINFNVFHNLTNLQQLNLSYNHIELLHYETFQSLQRLQNLDLSHNRILQIVPNLFHNLLELQLLALSYNNIQTIYRDTFYSLQHLQNLDLSHNNIISFHDSTFEYLPALRSLAINDNQIQDLYIDDLLLYSKQIHTISLDNNPWNCKSIENIASKCHQGQILIKPGQNYNASNVLGISCKTPTVKDAEKNLSNVTIARDVSSVNTSDNYRKVNFEDSETKKICNFLGISCKTQTVKDAEKNLSNVTIAKDVNSVNTSDNCRKVNFEDSETKKISTILILIVICLVITTMFISIFTLLHLYNFYKKKSRYNVCSLDMLES